MLSLSSVGANLFLCSSTSFPASLLERFGGQIKPSMVYKLEFYGLQIRILNSVYGHAEAGSMLSTKIVKPPSVLRDREMCAKPSKENQPHEVNAN